MSARRGRVVLFKDVMDEAIKRVLAVESEKSPDMSEEQRLRDRRTNRSGRVGIFDAIGG